MNYHNPEQLTEWGQADGWRLLTTEEIDQPLPDDAEFYSTGAITWFPSNYRGAMFPRSSEFTMRTKKPLPVSPLIAQLDAEIKAKQELKEIALAVETGAEWEVNVGKWESPVHSLKYYIDQEVRVRLKPKPVTRPWNKPEDVPGPVCWLRGPRLLGECMVTQITSNCIYTAGGRCFDLSKTGEFGYYQIADHEYSTDRINWFPCETTEEAK